MNSVQVPAYQAGMDKRFAIAARHSRMVRILRVAVPAAVVQDLNADEQKFASGTLKVSVTAKDARGGL